MILREIVRKYAFDPKDGLDIRNLNREFCRAFGDKLRKNFGFRDYGYGLPGERNKKDSFFMIFLIDKNKYTIRIRLVKKSAEISYGDLEQPQYEQRDSEDIEEVLKKVIEGE